MLQISNISTTLNKWFNEMTFSYALLSLSLLGMWYSLHNGISDLQVIMFIALKVALYVAIGSTFIKFLNGIGCNINKEIFEETNIAASILVAGFWIGLAIAIASGNLG